ncbi:MAG: hypothetical protein AAF790_00875 [Planctomycetota bacterium]
MATPPNRMYYAGFCRSCGTGPLGLRRCGGCEAIVLLCDECDAVWTSADTSAPPVLSEDPSLPCPHCTASLIGPSSAWATREQIDRTPWLVQAEQQGMKLNAGEAFAPDGPAAPDAEPPGEPTDEPVDRPAAGDTVLPTDLPTDAGG